MECARVVIFYAGLSFSKDCGKPTGVIKVIINHFIKCIL